MGKSKRSGAHRSGNPARRGTSSGTTSRQAAPKGSVRQRLERASVGPLARLHAMPRFLMPVLMGLLLLGGLAISAPWAGLFLLALGAFLSWLVALSWPALSPGSRAIRLVTCALVLGAGVWKLTGN